MSDTAELQFCTFLVDDFLFGVGVQDVQEVIRYQEMTRVPLAATVVGGLINLRGQIMTAIDLRRQLGLPDRPPGQLPMNVIVHREDGAASILVDEIGDVVEVNQSRYEAPPETLRGVARGLIVGVYKLDDRLLLILDTDRAVSTETDDVD
jgi:purine-binding chemotaxis protein CheW